MTITLLDNVITYIVNPLIGFMIALGVVMFLIGVVEFVAKSDNPEGRKIGLTHIFYSIVGLFIMVSVFGIMNFLCNVVGCN